MVSALKQLQTGKTKKRHGKLAGNIRRGRIQDMLARLLAFGFTFSSRPKTPAESPFAGWTFLFTGSLGAMSRDEAKLRVRERGGRVASQVSRKITHVVVGEKPGSKYTKARDMGLTILTEKEFTDLLAGGANPEGRRQLSIF